MWFRRLGVVSVLLLLLNWQANPTEACGSSISLELRATQSSHRLQVNAVGQDLMFLMVTATGYQVARVPNIAVSLVQKSNTAALLQTSDGATLSLTVVQDTASLYLVKVTWNNVKSEIWDCKELSEFYRQLIV